MTNKDEKTSEGLNQIVEIMNAKGDEGELKEIVGQSSGAENKTPQNDKNQ